METPDAAAVMETAVAAATTSLVVVDPIVADDHAVIAADARVGAGLEQPSTPKPKPSLSLVVSCKEQVIFFCKELVLPGLFLIQFNTCIGHKLQRTFEAYGWNDL